MKKYIQISLCRLRRLYLHIGTHTYYHCHQLKKKRPWLWMWATQVVDGRGWRKEREVGNEVIIIESQWSEWSEWGLSSCPSLTPPSVVTGLTVCLCPFTGLCYLALMSSFLWLLCVSIPHRLKCSFTPLLQACKCVTSSCTASYWLWLPPKVPGHRLPPLQNSRKMTCAKAYDCKKIPFPVLAPGGWSSNF